MDPIMKLEKECIRRRLSDHTRQAYSHYAQKFLDFTGKDITRISKEDVINYMDYLAARDVSSSTLNLCLNSIKFMLSSVNKNWSINLRYAKRPRRLPTFLSKEETIRLLQVIENPKHRLVVLLLYSSGMRVGELVNLRVRDLELSYGIGWVRNGKGRKDRVFVVSKSLTPILQQHIASKQYDDFVFSTKYGRISKETVYLIVKKAAKAAGILKNVHPHTLRHSFATHLIQDDATLFDVQRCLGHRSPNTTMTYLHAIPNLGIKSPLDNLKVLRLSSVQ
jgi:integrase/recombinase XerD